MATDLRVVHARGNGDSTDRFSQCATKCARAFVHVDRISRREANWATFGRERDIAATWEQPPR